jgi:beta-ureidopropionase
MYMKLFHCSKLLLFIMTVHFLSAAAFASGEEALIGRPVKVAAAAIGYHGAYTEKMEMATQYLHAAGKAGADIVCLPEEFSGGAPETIPGPTTEVVAALAKEYGMYVICPLLEVHEQSHYNTAVLIDRQGDIAGQYRKIFVVWTENAYSGEARVPYFDTDFGRIALLNCFDLNFPELWLEASNKGAEIVFWPSAFGGGFPLSAYAGIHAYYVVSVGDGDFYDMTGEPIPPDTVPLDKLNIATLDLDRSLVHKDYNRDKVAALLERYPQEITMERDWHPEGWYMLRALQPGIRVRDLCRRHNIEMLREYRLRSREQVNELRDAHLPIAANSDGVPIKDAAWFDAKTNDATTLRNRVFAAQLTDAWKRNHPMPPLSAVHPEAGWDDAYAIQRLFVERLCGLEKLAGYKAAGVSADDDLHPLVAVIPDAVDYDPTREFVLDLEDGAPRHIETEIGYHFGKTIRETVDSVDKLRDYVSAISAVIELPGAAVETYGPTTEIDLVAWNINGKTMLVGPKHDPNTIDPDAVAIQLSLDSSVINEARGDMTAHGQWLTLLKTVNHLIAQSYVIEAGQIISNGALGKINKARAGLYHADFGALGQLKFSAR